MCAARWVVTGPWWEKNHAVRHPHTNLAIIKGREKENTFPTVERAPGSLLGYVLSFVDLSGTGGEWESVMWGKAEWMSAMSWFILPNAEIKVNKMMWESWPKETEDSNKCEAGTVCDYSFLLPAVSIIHNIWIYCRCSSDLTLFDIKDCHQLQLPTTKTHWKHR